MKRKFSIIFAIVVFLLLFLHFQNNHLQVKKIVLNSKQIPNEFHGLKIVHLSDLHNKSFGKNQNRLVEKVKKLNPDLVFFTGDLIDSNHYKEKPGLLLLDRLDNIAPIYFVSGNHEVWSENFTKLKGKIENLDVKILEDENIELKNGSAINIIGLNDIADGESMKEKLDKIKFKSNDFNILLSHRPEYFKLYTLYNIDLVFSGHAHGGQVNLPFIGGLVSPGQGLFPKYSNGLYEKNKTKMIVSPGLGNSIIPQRLFNYPQIIFVELKKAGLNR